MVGFAGSYRNGRVRSPLSASSPSLPLKVQRKLFECNNGIASSMKPSAPNPRIKLSKLRDIGWSLWDPIGLLSTGGPFTGTWTNDANRGFADEYDNYLIAAASQIRRGASSTEVVGYLVQIESEHMGLGVSPTIQARAEAVIAAIMADEAIWTYPDEQGRFE